MTSVRKKKRNRILILVIILIIALAAYIGIVQYNKHEAAKDSTKTISVTDLDSDKIEKLEYTSGGENYSFIKDSDGTWKWEQDQTISITQSYVTDIVSNACSLKADRLLAENLDNIAEYGLDNPAYTVKLTDSDGQQEVIYIGSQNTSTSNYYAYVDGRTNVYTIDSTLIDTLGHTLNDMIEHSEVPTMTSDNITDISYTDADTSLNFDYYKEGNAQYDYSDSFLWFLNDNGVLTPADNTEMTTLFTDISSLKFDSLADYSVTNDDLNAYGLSNPQATLHVTYTTAVENSTDSTEDTSASTTTNTFTLYVGNTDSSGNYYVRAEGFNGVYTMTSDVITNFLNLNKINFTNKSPFNVLKDSIDSISITLEGTTYDIVQTKSKDKYSYTVNGKEADSDAVEAVYNTLKNLTAESAIAKGTAAAGTPYMSITFNRNTDTLKTVQIDLSTYDSSFYQANMDGRDTLLLNKIVVEELVKNVEELTK